MLIKIESASLFGIDGKKVEIEIDSEKSDRNNLIIVGLPDAAIKESKERILAAIRHTGLLAEPIKATINLAPADLKKEGTLYDLPIALGLLESLGKLPRHATAEFLVAGELGLSGELRPLCGAMALATLARSIHKKGLILPHANAKEAAFVNGITTYGIHSLKEAIAFLNKTHQITPALPRSQSLETSYSIDFSMIQGQANLKRAIEIAAAGKHNLLMSGPPGSGKTLIAKALPSILPPLSLAESLEVTKIYSSSGILPKGLCLIEHPPFRSPHHTISYAGMIGGGTYPKPGEVTLAHHGVLFLDELPEFSRQTLEVLRQPLEDRFVTIARAKHHLTYPTNFLLIAAMNPCPCGYYGHPEKNCSDSHLQIERYRKKISGPLLDRIDLHVVASPLKFKDLSHNAFQEPSKEIQQRVISARNIQYERFRFQKTNSMMDQHELALWVTLDQGCQNLLKEAVEMTNLSARQYHRLLKVARTIADLDKHLTVEEHHVLEALSYSQSSSSSAVN